MLVLLLASLNAKKLHREKDVARHDCLLEKRTFKVHNFTEPNDELPDS